MPLICFGYISTHHTLQHTPIYFNSTNCDSTTSFFSFIIYLLAFICIFSLEWFLWKGLGKVCEMDCWLRRGKEWSFRFTSRFPNLTFSRELWVVSKRMRSRTHEAQMSFRWRVAGLIWERDVWNTLLSQLPPQPDTWSTIKRWFNIFRAAKLGFDLPHYQ